MLVKIAKHYISGRGSLEIGNPEVESLLDHFLCFSLVDKVAGFTS